MRVGRSHLAVVLWALAVRGASAQGVDPFDHLRFKMGDETVVASRSDRLDIDIDQTIGIEWNERSLLRALASSRGLANAQPPQDERIAYLEQLTGFFLQANALLGQFKSAATDLAAARMTSADAQTVQRLEAQRDAVASRFAAAADSGLTLIRSAPERLTDPAAGRALVDRANAILLESGTRAYEELSAEVGRVLEQELSRVESQLRGQLSNDSIQVYMEAWLRSTGATRRLHLDGYDRIAVGPPTPFPRIQLAVSDRAARELDAAARLGDLVENADELRAQVEEAVATLERTLDQLARVIQSDVLDARLNALVADLRMRSEARFAPLIDLAARTRSRLAQLPREIDTSTPAGQAAALLVVAGQVESSLRELGRVTPLLANDLGDLADSLAEQVSATRGLVAQDALDHVERAARTLRDDPAVGEILNSVAELADVLGLSRSVALQAEDVGAIGRSATGAPLDSWLELVSAGERHPGDDLLVRTRIVARSGDGGEIDLARATQRFRLRSLGLHVAPRGALLFVDPREAAFAGQDFEPSVSLSFIAHLGVGGSGFMSDLWNDVLDMGAGLTIAMLDFEDESDFELGLGGSVTVFRDLFWVGYGRDLQAETNVFYVGVNPLAFGDFFRGGGSPLPDGAP